MPPRPSSRCCQALHTHASAPVEAVWVTDDILGRAFQRYMDVSRPHRRTVSYAPGPMYHRKRFGRRQMTELNSFQSVGALPVWALSNAPDMMEWQWQPPKPDLWSPRPSPSPSPSPPLPAAPPSPGPAPVPEPEPLLQPSLKPEPSEVTIVDKPQAQNNWKCLHNQLHDIRTNHVRSIRACNDNFWDFIKNFERVLMQGGFSGPAAADVYKTAIEDIAIIERRFPASARWLRINLMSSMASGVRSARRANRNFLLRGSNIFMLHIAQHEANVYSADLLSFAMANLRPGPSRKYYDIVFKALDHFFDLWRGVEVNGKPDNYDWSEISQTSHMASIWAGRLDRACDDVEALLAIGEIQEARVQLDIAKRLLGRVQRFALKTACLMSDDSTIAEKIAIALMGSDPRHHRILFTQVTRLVGDQSTNWSRAKYNWLQIVARLSKISTNQFKRLLEIFPRRGHAALSQAEICNLLLLHWESKGKLPPGGETRQIWNSYRGYHDHSALAAFALAVSMTTCEKKCSAIFWSFWEILRHRGGPRVFLRQLSMLSKREDLKSGFLQRLAWTSNDHRLALILHNMYVTQSGRSTDFNSWWPPFWDKYARRLGDRWKYPLVDPINLLTKLFNPDPDLRPLQPQHSTMIERQYHESLSSTKTQHLDGQGGLDRAFTPLDQEENKTMPREGSQRQVERLKFGLKLLVQARQITDRQALRIVTQFTAVLADKQGFLSARNLAILTSVVMRTLDKGQSGSKERFKWFLGVIDRFLGRDACIQVGLILQRRRDANLLAWRRRLTGDGPMARRTSELSQQLRPPPMRLLWHTHVYQNKRRKGRILKLHAPIRRRRGQLIALGRSKMDIKKAGKEDGTKDADSLLTSLQLRGVDMTPPAAENTDEDGFAIMLKQPRRENIGNDVSF